MNRPLKTQDEIGPAYIYKIPGCGVELTVDLCYYGKDGLMGTYKTVKDAEIALPEIKEREKNKYKV